MRRLARTNPPRRDEDTDSKFSRPTWRPGVVGGEGGFVSQGGSNAGTGKKKKMRTCRRHSHGIVIGGSEENGKIHQRLSRTKFDVRNSVDVSKCCYQKDKFL